MTRATEGAGSIRLCLTGGWFDSPNVGDNAILVGIVESITQVAPAVFTVLTPNPDRVQALHGLPALAPRRHPFKLLRLLWSVDALVFTGGSPFFDHVAQMLYCAALAAVARLSGAKVIVWGIWLRPLKSPFCRMLVRFVCRQAAYLSGRDHETVRGLSELMNGTRCVAFVPDPAARMIPASNEDAGKLLAEQGVESPRKAIAICLRDFRAGRQFGMHHYDRLFSSREIDNYLDATSRMVMALLEHTDYTLLFLPMHTLQPDDDRNPAVMVAERLGTAADPNRVKVVTRQFQPREMKALLGLMDVVVGMRFHSLLLASSMGIPVVSIAYASKNESLMDLIEQRKHMIKLQDVSGEWLSHHVLEVLSSREIIRADITAKYAAFAAVYETELARLLGLFSGPDGSLRSKATRETIHV
ncbi:MAG TPA: polysaccharide pyruvyl transferase family protein [Nitrospira sp.]|jgi:polysaccharide pyruvyl transferase WcaK-like protein|nr:polysaccharide pyruvyl transferase family protein [Nitrospira sp.]